VRTVYNFHAYTLRFRCLPRPWRARAWRARRLKKGRHWRRRRTPFRYLKRFLPKDIKIMTLYLISIPTVTSPYFFRFVLTPFPRREIGLLAENGISLPFARGALPRPSRCSHRSIRSPGGSENGRRHFPAIFLWIASPPRRVLGSWSGCEINR
jgi:hypothetical protein